MQVARKIAPCDRALIHVCLAYLFLHSRQVLSSCKCYFKPKYLNLIDSDCDVDESCPWFFIATVLATGPEFAWPNVGLASLLLAICRVGLAARNFGNGRVVLCTWETIIASSGLQLLWDGYVFFGFFVCILYNIITIQYNLIFVNLGGPFVFYNLYFFCTDLTKKWVS